MKRWKHRPEGSTWGDWGDDEFNAFQPALDHVVDGIAACSAHTENSNTRFEIGKIRNGEFDCHLPRPD